MRRGHFESVNCCCLDGTRALMFNECCKSNEPEFQFYCYATCVPIHKHGRMFIRFALDSINLFRIPPLRVTPATQTGHKDARISVRLWLWPAPENRRSFLCDGQSGFLRGMPWHLGCAYSFFGSQQPAASFSTPRL